MGQLFCLACFQAPKPSTSYTYQTYVKERCRKAAAKSNTNADDKENSRTAEGLPSSSNNYVQQGSRINNLNNDRNNYGSVANHRGNSTVNEPQSNSAGFTSDKLPTQSKQENKAPIGILKNWKDGQYSSARVEINSKSHQNNSAGLPAGKLPVQSQGNDKAANSTPNDGNDDRYQFSRADARSKIHEINTRLSSKRSLLSSKTSLEELLDSNIKLLKASTTQSNGTAQDSNSKNKVPLIHNSSFSNTAADREKGQDTNKNKAGKLGVPVSAPSISRNLSGKSNDSYIQNLGTSSTGIRVHNSTKDPIANGSAVNNLAAPTAKTQVRQNLQQDSNSQDPKLNTVKNSKIVDRELNSNDRVSQDGNSKASARSTKHKTTLSFEQELLQKINNDIIDEGNVCQDGSIENFNPTVAKNSGAINKNHKDQSLTNDTATKNVKSGETRHHMVDTTSNIVVEKYDAGVNKTTEDTTRGSIFTMTPSLMLLFQQLGSQHQLVQIANRKEIQDHQELFANIKDSQDGISPSLSTFLCQYPQLVKDMNTKFRNRKIKAGIHYNKKTISIVAISKQEYDKAVTILNTDILTNTYQISYTKDLLWHWIAIYDVLTKKLASHLGVLIQCWMNTKEKVVTVEVVGSSNTLDNVITKVQQSLNDFEAKTAFTLYDDEFFIQELPQVKAQYLKQHYKEEIEDQYCCQLQFHSIEDLDSDLKYQVIIKYPHERITTEIRQIKEKISSIPIAIKKFSYDGSQLSRIARFIIHGRRHRKIKEIMANLKCSFTISDVAVESKVNVKKKQEKTSNENLATSKNRRSKRQISSSASTDYGDDQIYVLGLCMKLIRGRIEEQGRKTDVIVNSVDVYDFEVGAIARALYQAGGRNYRRECDNLSQYLDGDEIGCTDGYRLRCKKVYHVPFLSSPRTLTWLNDKIYECLDKANRESMKAISIPTIGTGSTGFSYDTIAKEMIDVAIEFAKNSGRRNLKVVRFVVFENDVEAYYSYSKIFKRINSHSDGTSRLSDLTKCDGVGLVERLTNATKTVMDMKENPLEILFSAVSTDSSRFRLNFYHGSIYAAETSAILNPTKVCSSHLQQGKLSERLDRNWSRMHWSWTLSSSQETVAGSSRTIYTCCPYDMIDDFQSLLNHINGNGESSLTCPLASTEIKEEDICSLFTAIASFLKDRSKINCPLSRLDFITGNNELAHEIACWAQRQITVKRRDGIAKSINWHISQSYSYHRYGKSIDIIAGSNDIIDQVEKNLADSAPCWISKEVQEEDLIDNFQDIQCLKLINELWCQFGTLTVCNPNSNKMTIYGYEDDVFQATNRIQKFARERDCQVMVKEWANDSLEIAKWSVEVEQTTHTFSPEMNYEIEKGYQIFIQNKYGSTHKFDDKIINYDDMAIQMNNLSFTIMRKSIHHDDLPSHWTRIDNDDENMDQNLLVDVCYGEEFNEIDRIVNSSHSCFHLMRLQRVQNKNLYKRYQLCKKEVTESVQKHRSRFPVERRLFYGTDPSSINRIYKTGFDRDFDASAGAEYGIGTYLHENILSVYPSKNTLLLVRAITGIYGLHSGQGKINLGVIPGSEERIHSAVNNVRHPSTFVILNDNAAYPEYILHIRG
ncbi:Poly [ADP-ribose] polymerase 9 [Trichoplax sp. H2]|nr:Poly [ADP-ribose] polymerase 9 [Trichoplax sp. H2]|eukprot:RDD38020.1 Poly [ADP-ribose] polymerase 9 [Trichoplax sp. H2]